MAQQQIQPKLMVDSLQLDQIVALRRDKTALKERLARIEAQLDDVEAQVIGLVQDGADFSGTGYQLEILETQRRYPAWRDIVVERLGKAVADQVLAETAAKISYKLVIK